jgi:hypothetical protein
MAIAGNAIPTSMHAVMIRFMVPPSARMDARIAGPGFDSADYFPNNPIHR